MTEEVTASSDSDWAGCMETRKSSSAGVILIGDNMLKAHTRKQHNIANSSAEPEFYAAALDASESTGIVSWLCDLGYVMKPVLAIDAKSHWAHCPQARSWSLKTPKWHTSGYKTKSDPKNVAHLGTTALSKAVILKHSITLEYVNTDEEGLRMPSKTWPCSEALVQVQRFETGGRTGSSQNTAGDHAKQQQQQQRWTPWTSTLLIESILDRTNLTITIENYFSNGLLRFATNIFVRS